MDIKKVKIMRQAYSTVYHVEDEGCIQEFNTLKGAEDFVKHLEVTMFDKLRREELEKDAT